MNGLIKHTHIPDVTKAVRFGNFCAFLFQAWLGRGKHAIVVVHPQPKQTHSPVQEIQGPFQLQVFRRVHEKGKWKTTITSLLHARTALLTPQR